MAEPASAPEGDPADPEAAQQSEKKDDKKEKKEREPTLPEVPPEHLSHMSRDLYEIWRQEYVTEEVVHWFLKADVDVRSVKDLATMVMHQKDEKETEKKFLDEVVHKIRLKIHLKEGQKLKKGQPTHRDLDKDEAHSVTASFLRAAHIYNVQSKSVLPANEFEPQYLDLTATEWMDDFPIRENRYPQGNPDTMTFYDSKTRESWLPASEKKQEGEAEEEAHHHHETGKGTKKARPAVDSMAEWKSIDDDKKSTAVSEKTQPLTRVLAPENNPYTQGKQRQIEEDCNRIDSIVGYGKAAHPQGIASDVMDWGKRMLGFGSSQSGAHNPNQDTNTKKHTMEDMKQNDVFYIEDWKAMDSSAALDALDRSHAHKSIFEDRIQMDRRHKEWEKERDKMEKSIMKQAETPEEGVEACRFASVDYESLQRWKCGVDAPPGFA